MVMAMNNIRRGTMLFAIAVVVFALGQTEVSLVSSLGLDESFFWEAVAATEAKKSYQSEKTSEIGFKVDLMQYHHQKSPYATPNLSLEQRVAIAVKSSRERAEILNSRISKSSKTVSSGFSNKAVFSSPVFSEQGAYLMQIELGTPAKRYVTIVDTGSDLVWVQCTPCPACFPQPDPFFNPTQSSSYSTTSCSNALCNALPTRLSCVPACEYEYSYGDQSSTQGTFSLETITLTSTSGAPQSFPGFGFGCGNVDQGTFSGTDGLTGLGQGSVSLVGQLGSQFGNVFSYCLVSFYSSTSVTSPLLLGSTGGAVSNTPLITSSANPSFYYVNLEEILVGGSPVSIPTGTFQVDDYGSGFILDSGTTITQLQDAAYTPFLSTMENFIGNSYPRVDGSSIGFDLCYDLAGQVNPVVPTVTFKFEGYEMDLPANNIFLQVDNEGVFCLAFQGSSFGMGILGNIQQQNFNIAYDLANRVIGFASRKC